MLHTILLLDLRIHMETITNEREHRTFEQWRRYGDY